MHRFHRLRVRGLLRPTLPRLLAGSAAPLLLAAIGSGAVGWFSDDAAAQSIRTAASDGLAEAPLDAEGLGFSMRVPAGCTVRIERGRSLSYLLAEDAEQPAWRVRATSITASKPGTTARSQCEDYLAEVRTRDPKVEVLVNEPFLADAREGHVVYLAVPLETGGRGIMGMLALPSAPDAYLAFSMLIVDGSFASVRPLLERSFATIAVRDVAKAAAEDLDLLVRGAELVGAITEQKLRATIDSEPRVYRMWRTDDTGARQDYGYMVIRVREGRQGEVDASKDPAKFKGEDNEAGLLASIDARIVVNNDPTHTVDAQSRYFVRWDRAAEAWSIRTTERQKRASRSSAQTGLRLAPSAGAPRPVLQVITASRDGMTREPQEWAVPPAYLSQAELIVLGELLPRDAVAADSASTIAASPGAGLLFKDYAFDQREQKLPQRHEKWTRTATGWRLETRQGSSPAMTVQEFDGRGKRVRRTDVDGSVTELIKLEDLRALWKSKGLPVD
jgi:hypothetical protein